MEYCSIERMIVCAEFVQLLDPLYPYQILAAVAYLANSVSALPLKHSTESIGHAPAASAASTAIPRSVRIRDKHRLYLTAIHGQ